MGFSGEDFFILCRQHEDPSSIWNPQPHRRVIGEHFEAMCESNTGRWTAEQGKIAEGSCDGLQKPANVEISFLLEWKPELSV